MEEKECCGSEECTEEKCIEDTPSTENPQVTIDEYLVSTAKLINEEIKKLGTDTPHVGIFTMFSNLTNTYVQLVDMQRELILELHGKLIKIQEVLTPKASEETPPQEQVEN